MTTPQPPPPQPPTPAPASTSSSSSSSPPKVLTINDLNNDCLLLIFDQISNIMDLHCASVVCSLWRSLIFRRLRRVRYFLQEVDWPQVSDEIRVNAIYIHSDEDALFNNEIPIDEYPQDDSKLSVAFLKPKYFPNLRILNINEYYPPSEDPHVFEPNPRSIRFHRDLIRFLRHSRAICGLNERQGTYSYHCRNIEMISSMIIGHYFDAVNGAKLKQINLDNHFDHFLDDYQFFPNLEILSARFYHLETEPVTAFFPNLDTLILADHCSSQKNMLTFAFDLIDRCEKLRSAYLYSFYDPPNPDFNAPCNERLKDLVICFDLGKRNPYDMLKYAGNRNQENPGLRRRRSWTPSELVAFLSRYPNLENLALRQTKVITLDHIKSIVKSFPKLVTLDVRYCKNICKDSEEFVRLYNRTHGRSIDFHYNSLSPRSLPFVEHELDRLFIEVKTNFMGNYFFKNYIKVPIFLDER